MENGFYDFLIFFCIKVVGGGLFRQNFKFFHFLLSRNLEYAASEFFHRIEKVISIAEIWRPEFETYFAENWKNMGNIGIQVSENWPQSNRIILYLSQLPHFLQQTSLNEKEENLLFGLLIFFMVIFGAALVCVLF